MSESATVISLASVNNAWSEVRTAPLPETVQELQDKGKEGLSKPLKVFFKQADDRLFNLSTQFSGNESDNPYFAFMRGLRVKSRQIERLFNSAIDQAFQRLMTPADDNGVPLNDHTYLDTWSVDNMSLVQDDELEQRVAVDAMVSRANSSCEVPLQHLTLRLDSLMPIKAYQANNPLGPGVLCNAFLEAIEELDSTIATRLVALKTFETTVLSQLPQVYNTANGMLTNQNILPNLSRNAGTGAHLYKRSAQEQSAPGQGSSSHTPHENEQEPSLPKVQELLEHYQSAFGSGHSDTAGTQDMSALFSMLSKLQEQQTAILENQKAHTSTQAIPNTQTTATVVDLNPRLKNLSSSERESVGQKEEELINLISKLFTYILEDRNLPAPMKDLLSHLQIPMIKLSLSDPEFFNENGHPARHLLNEMATAAMGWQDNGGRKDSLYRKVETTVHQVLNEQQADSTTFQALSEDFDGFIAMERRRANILEKRMVEAEQAKARAEHARQQVQMVYQGYIQGRELPEIGRRILDDAWSQVLFLCCLNKGMESPEWKAHLQTTADLIWSVTAPLDKASYERLVKLSPGLGKRLRTELEAISFDPFQMTELFKSLKAFYVEHIQATRKAIAEQAAHAKALAEQSAIERAAFERAAIEKAALEKAAAEADALKLQLKEEQRQRRKQEQERIIAELAVAELAVKEPGADEQKMNVLAVNGSATNVNTQPATVPGKPVTNPAYLKQVERLNKGSWFELQEGEQSFRCRLAAILDVTGTYIFVNRAGMKAAEFHQDDLAQALEQGTIKQLDDGILFDRALKAVISDLHTRN